MTKLARKRDFRGGSISEFFHDVDVKRSLPIAAVLISAAIMWRNLRLTLATPTTSGYVSAGSKQARAARRVAGVAGRKQRGGTDG
jgi:hypothetical protein